MLGLIGGALSGGAEAAQENAKTRIKTMHDKTMERMRQKYQTSEREAGQDFTAEQGEIDRSFRAGESEADRAQRLRLAQMQENGANSRAAQGGWTLTEDANGNPVRFNTITGAQEPVEGIDFDSIGSGDLTDIQKRQLDRAEREINAIYEGATDEMGEQRPLTKEEAAAVKGWRDAENEILNPGQGGSGGSGGGQGGSGGGQGGNDGPTILEQLLQGEGGDNPDPGGNNDEVKPPPGVDETIEAEEGQDDSTVTGLINQGISEQQNKQSEAQERRVLRDIDQQIRQMKSQIRIAGTGPGVTQAERDAAAEKVIQMAKELEDNGLMDSMQPVQSEAIQDIVNQAVQYSSQY